MTQGKPFGHIRAFVITEDVPENEVSGEAILMWPQTDPDSTALQVVQMVRLLRDPSAFLAFVSEKSQPRTMIKSW